jgi:transposase
MCRHKKWTPAVKFEIVVVAMKGEITINEICRRYEVSPSQVHMWKKEFLEHGAQVFSKGNKGTQAGVLKLERKQSKLYEEIGKLIVERDFLKKSYGRLTGDGGED